MNLKQRHSLLEENIKLRRDNDKLSIKFDEMTSLLKKMSDKIDNLSNVSTTQQILSSTETITQQDPERIFIPTPSGEGLKSKIGDLKSTKRLANLNDAADKLSKINDLEK